jgi:nucleotide-binding universal stress UspA family protein
MYTDIVVPLDGSQAATAAVLVGLDLAIRYTARLVLLHAVPPGDGGEGPDTGARNGVREEGTRRSQAEGYLSSIERSLRRPGVTIRTVVPVGEPAAAILETTRSLREPLVVMTANGSSSPGDGAAIGSVAEQLLRRGRAPILLLRPEGA